MHGGNRFWTSLVLGFALVACATVKSTEDLEEVDDRAAEGEPDAGSDGNGKDGDDDDTESVTDDTDADDGETDGTDSSDADGSTDSSDDGSSDSSDDGSTDDGSTDDGSSDDGSTDDGTTDDGTNDDGSTDDGTTDDDGTPDTTCITPTVGSGSDGLIDDLDDGNYLLSLRDGRNGHWVVYDDASAPALMPSVDGDLTPTMVGAGYVAQVAGGPYTTWGASLGFTLRRGPQGEYTCPYDASAYSGIRFKAKGSGSVRFKVRDATTDADPESYDGHGAPVTLTSTLTTYTLCFATMVQDYGSTTNLQKNKMLNMHWQVDTGVTMALTLDDVSFVAGACTNSP
jgi:hypothetical protein